MKDATEESTPPTVSCHVCHQEVPKVEALTVEGQEYLYFFCGQGCYIHWKEDNDQASPTRKQ